VKETTIPKVNTYLSLDGTAAEAMRFHEKAYDGTIEGRDSEWI